MLDPSIPIRRTTINDLVPADPLPPDAPPEHPAEAWRSSHPEDAPAEEEHE